MEKAAGRVSAFSVNEGIRLVDVTGDMSAETTNGDIVVENAQTSSLEISTVNGDVTFNGTVRDKGSYRLTTHGGDIRVGLGGAQNATVFVRTFQGDFTADFPIQLPEGQTPRSGSKRFNFTLGNGSARIEVQSFNGDIVLARGRIVTAEELRQQRRKSQPNKEHGFEHVGAQVSRQVSAEISQVVSQQVSVQVGQHISQQVGAQLSQELAWVPQFDFDFDFDHDFDFDFDHDFDFDIDHDFEVDIDHDFNFDFDHDVDFDFDLDFDFDFDFDEFDLDYHFGPIDPQPVPVAAAPKL